VNIDLSAINYLAVLVSAASIFVIGGLWYSVIFAKPWMAASGVTEERARQGSQLGVFGGAFLLSLVASFVLAMFIGKDAGAFVGLLAGLFAALGWVAPFLGIYYVFERRPFAHFAVNGGYGVVSLSVMGIILGAW
jgi:hypothetical protein